MQNPYQTPKSGLSESDGDQSHKGELATRGTRFLAVLIDGIIGLILAIPFWLASGAWIYFREGRQLPYTYTLAAVVYGFIGFALIHYYFLNRDGQTVGKKLLKIRIIGIDGQHPGAVPLLLKRYLPMSLISLVPLIGSLLGLIDILFIFRKDRRCVHDLIAGTKVVNC
ncbi:MAG: RDD family protein [Candidatus Thiodiazotropha sp.]